MFMQTGDGTQGTMFTCADEGRNSVIQYSFVMQLMQMRGETQYNNNSFVM